MEAVKPMSGIRIGTSLIWAILVFGVVTVSQVTDVSANADQDGS